jgi:glucose-6-phosphate 1-dehydrogenase
LQRNEFVLRVQPDPAIYMKMTVKDPGMRLRVQPGELELSYDAAYNGVVIPDAYERLILDCINGDQQHFVRRDELK